MIKYKKRIENNLTIEDFKDIESETYIPIKIVSIEPTTKKELNIETKKHEPKPCYLYGIECVKKYNRTNIIRAIRKKYSIDDELAILRQRDEKPEEYKEYYDYVETIKSKLKNQEVK